MVDDAIPCKRKTPERSLFQVSLSFHIYMSMYLQNYIQRIIIHLTYSRFGYALDLLVTVSSMRYRTSTSALSTSSSSRGLTNLTLWDISS